MERREFDHLEAEAEKFKKQREEADKEMETLNPIKKIQGFAKKREAAKRENYYNKTKEIELGYVQGRAERINTFLDWMGTHQEKYDNWIKNSFGGNAEFEKIISLVRGGQIEKPVDPDNIEEGTTYPDHVDFLKKNMVKLDVWVHRTLSGWDHFYQMVENDKYVKLSAEDRSRRSRATKGKHSYYDPGQSHRNHNYPHGTY